MNIINSTVELRPDEKNRIKKSVLEMDSLKFQTRLGELNERFEKLFHEATLVAQEIQVMKDTCSHGNAVVPGPHSKFCLDCREVVAVRTSFSPEVEQWFTEQNRLAMERNPMVIHPPLP